MTTKKTDEKIEGRPIFLKFQFEGSDSVIEYQLRCPICGATHFVFSKDHEFGGCASDECPGVCFERVQDFVEFGGIEWRI